MRTDLALPRLAHIRALVRLAQRWLVWHSSGPFGTELARLADFSAELNDFARAERVSLCQTSQRCAKSLSYDQLQVEKAGETTQLLRNGAALPIQGSVNQT